MFFARLNQKPRTSFQNLLLIGIFCILILTFNLVALNLIRSTNIHIAQNQSPGLFFGGNILAFLIFIVSLLLLSFNNFWKKNVVGSALLISGIFSNALEKQFFGYVSDYIWVGIATINLADLQIYYGLALLIFGTVFTNHNNRLTK